MSAVSKILLYKDEPGGETGRVTKILCQAGDHVEADQHLFDIETAKACQEIRSPKKGIVFHSLCENQEVRFGAILAEIKSETPKVGTAHDAEIPATSGLSPAVFSGERLSHAPVVSHEARLILEKLRIDPASLGKHLITSAIVQQKYNSSAPNTEEVVVPPADTRQGYSALPMQKVQETAILNGCDSGSYLSMVGVEIVRNRLQRRGAGFFEDKILDLVVFESARLMQEFPNLNAAYRHPGQIEHYRNATPGVAFNGAGRLMVYAIRIPGLASVELVRAEILSGFKKYVANNLTRDDSIGATYTITDLSGSGTEFVLPLMPTSQSCIIGLTTNPGGGYRAFLAFDHRVTDGFEAARFLNRLSSRIKKALGETGYTCGCCGASPVSGDTRTMLLSIHDRDGNGGFCCRRCWSEPSS